MAKKFYYHNELYCRTKREVKRRFMDICREKNIIPNDLLNDIIQQYVFDNTPHDAFSRKIYDIRNWFNTSRAQLYNLYSALLLMMIGAVLIVLMQKFNQSIWFIVLFFVFLGIILAFSKWFFVLGKSEKKFRNGKHRK